MLDTFYLSSFFRSIVLINYVSSYRKMWREPMNNVRDWHKYSQKWGKIDPSHLLNENGDLSFLLYFSKQCLVENIQRKFQNKLSVTFISEESP